MLKHAGEQRGTPQCPWQLPSYVVFGRMVGCDVFRADLQQGPIPGTGLFCRKEEQLTFLPRMGGNCLQFSLCSQITLAAERAETAFQHTRAKLLGKTCLAPLEHIAGTIAQNGYLQCLTQLILPAQISSSFPQIINPLIRQQSPSRQLGWEIILQTPGGDSPTKMFPLVLLHSPEWC